MANASVGRGAAATRVLWQGLVRVRPVQRVLSTSTDQPAPAAEPAARRKQTYRSLIAAAADSLSKSRARGATWGQATQEAVISYRQGKMDDAFKQFLDHALATPKYDLVNGFKSSIEQSLQMTTLQKLREMMPWSKQDPNKLELENQKRIIDNMSPLDLLFPLKINAARKRTIALAAGTISGAVSKLIRHFAQARAIHDFVHARKRWNKPMPNDTKELFELMRVAPSTRGYELMVEANQKRHQKRRRIVNHQRNHFKRGH